MPEIPSVVTAKGEQVDDYHGELVADPYRWLEDTDSPEARAWIRAQNDRTEAFLAAVPGREAVRSRLSELWDYPRSEVPFGAGEAWFQRRNSGLQDQSVLFVMGSPEEEGRVLLDPNLLSSDGTVAVSAVAVTGDGSLLAYATSTAGSDWMTWHVREVASGTDRPDLVEWCRYGTAAWRDGSGFYYSATDRPEPGAELTGQVGLVRIFFHALGTPQAQDRLVFEAPQEPEWLPHATVTEDGRFLVISISRGTNPESQVLVLDHDRPDRGLQPLVAGFSCKASVAANVGTTFFVVTDDQAERQRLVVIDLDHPERQAWREVVPERAALLVGAKNCGGRLVCHHLQDACSRLSVLELDGAHVRDLALPPITSLRPGEDEVGIEGRADSPLVHFGLCSFIDSGSLWSHDIATGETRVLEGPAAPLDAGALVTEQFIVTADDGAAVPLFLTRRHDVAPTGEAPALLVGYGGFDIPMTPAFSSSHALFVERGGILAVAVLRGGGEYGRSWHDAGRLANKQRVFDDFCDCARWLASSGWSRRARTAINGGSNGGLLVGACLTQHPELFGAAVPEVGVLDMLRFHRFTIGWAWKSDFGDPDDPEQYRWARAYSPLHNIKPGVRYPPTFITTGDHDDRVVPGHSFKFAAALQAAQGAGAEAPVLIRIETSAGHGLGKPTSKAISERADVLTFLEAVLGR
ncbi:MAG: prolyl oligopeptidase family serine peptidase [Acidimicrobiales bacterium]